jgi:hypothetical protein
MLLRAYADRDNFTLAMVDLGEALANCRFDRFYPCLRRLFGVALRQVGNRLVCFLRERDNLARLNVEHECSCAGGAAIDAETEHDLISRVGV